MLLRGWMEIGAGRITRRVEYSTRCFAPIVDFTRELRRAAFPNAEGRSLRADRFGDEFDDVKFSRAGDSELDPGELVGPTFLSLPRRQARRVWLTHREVWQPGDLVILTERRLIWITDRYKGLCEPYGRVARSARVRDIQNILVLHSTRDATLRVVLTGGEWAIAVTREHEAAANGFADAVARTIRAWV